jgi:hypothetical protein
MESRMKRNGLIYDSQIAIEMRDLTAQIAELLRQRGRLISVLVGAEEAIKRGLDKRGFCGSRSLGCVGQPRRRAFGEIDANPGFHSRASLKRD